MNKDYEALAQIAYNEVLKTMQEGEQDHGEEGWKGQDVYQHACHAWQHINDFYVDDKAEDHIAHTMTRCAMIRWLENDKR